VVNADACALQAEAAQRRDRQRDADQGDGRGLDEWE
jgi:hypothetical protein